MDKYKNVLENVQEHISKKYYHSLLNLEKNDNRAEEQIKSYIEKYIYDNKISFENISKEELTIKLYRDMALFSFLSDYLDREDIEEININAWNDTKITYTDGRIEPSKENFLSAKFAEDIIKRLLRKSNMVLDNSQPTVRGFLDKNKRITVLGNGVIDEDVGIVASIRIVNPQKLEKEDFVKRNTISQEMIDDIELFFKYGISMCITGSASAGKTTFMSWLLSTIDNNKRVFTIENNVREFDLVKKDESGNVINNIIHTVTKYSKDENNSIDQEKLLEIALTSNPDYICVGEMKGSESFASQEAARTAHTVITTTHANSCIATYYRMVTLCKLKYEIEDKTLFNLVTEAFPIVVFLKKLEDNSRKVMEITECIIKEDGKREFQTLYRYNIKSQYKENGKIKINGEFVKVNNVSEYTQRRLIENGIPIDELEKLIKR